MILTPLTSIAAPQIVAFLAAAICLIVSSQLVSTLKVNPEFNLLVFNSTAKLNLSITGGSCFLETAVNDSHVVEAIQSPPGLQCSQLTVSPKGLGTALVTVYDIGLAPAIKASSVVVQVAEIDWIKIVAGEEISLMEGQSASIDLVAGISDGYTFDSNQFAYMNIHVWIEDDIVQLVDDRDAPTLGGGYLKGRKIKIFAKKLGITALHVSTKQRSGSEILSQPIKIEVYEPLRIHPHDIFLSLGSSYALTVKGGPTTGAHVEFASLDGGIAIDKTSGQLTAKGVSENVVSVNAPKELLTNVPYPTKGYSFLVKFSDTYNKFDAFGNRKEILYDCKVDPDFLGYAMPWMDVPSGTCYCLFFPHSPEHLVRTIPRLEDMRPYVSVSIIASLREASHVSGSASALFVGGFSILEMEESSMQLNLTRGFNRTVITILGNTDVDIRWHNSDSLKVSPIQKEDFGIGGRAKYEIKVLEETQTLKDKIMISLPSTGQRCEIDVNYEFYTRAEAINMIVSILAVYLIAVFGTIICSGRWSDGYDGRHAPSFPTNTKQSSLVLSELSPQTPRPFVDYLRSTIEETPFYKREARRRFNPHNTY